MPIFDKKTWNDKVYLKYMQTIPRVKQNALLNAGVFKTRNDLRSKLSENVGGNYIVEPMTGRIGGTVLNYDGNTDIIATGLDTYTQGKIVHGRAKAWTEKDFTYDISGKDFMAEITSQVSDYYDDVDSHDLLSILSGIFGVTTDGFSEKNTYNITAAVNTADRVVSPDTLNNAIQQAAGDNKNIFTLAIMHSTVATHLENLELLTYRTQTDANGIQRRLNLADWNGRTVLIDDEVPTLAMGETAGVYEVTLAGTWAADDKVAIAGHEHTVVSGSTAASAIAEAVAALFATDEIYSAAASGGKITITTKTGHYDAGVPTVTKTSTNGTTSIVTKTAPVIDTAYTTYILGQNAFDYCDCGAKVSSEVWRDPKTKGGEDWLITRQRKLFAPTGFSFVNTNIVSPTASDFINSSNWDLIASTESGIYYPTKAIPMARIISLG